LVEGDCWTLSEGPRTRDLGRTIERSYETVLHAIVRVAVKLARDVRRLQGLQLVSNKTHLEFNVLTSRKLSKIPFSQKTFDVSTQDAGLLIVLYVIDTKIRSELSPNTNKSKMSGNSVHRHLLGLTPVASTNDDEFRSHHTF
jgi:hypothetical protein